MDKNVHLFVGMAVSHCVVVGRRAATPVTGPAYFIVRIAGRRRKQLKYVSEELFVPLQSPGSC